jgi:hypothetical protein
MSDDSEALREAVRQADRQRREDARYRNAKIERDNRRDRIVNAFLHAVADAREQEETALFRGVSFDSTLHISPIAAHLKEVIKTLRDDGLFADMQDLDCEALFKHCSWSPLGEYGTAEQARACFDYAKHALMTVIAEDKPLDDLIRELFFDRQFRPAGVWFQVLVRTLARMSIWFEKEKSEGTAINGPNSGNVEPKPSDGVDPSKTLGKEAGPSRSWTQADLDNAIREYKAKRVPQYNDLLEGVRRGRPGARKYAQRLFGRNALARALGVRARAMVSKSEPWREIAEELRLPRGRKGRPHLNGSKRIGLSIAEEEKAVDEFKRAPILEELVNKETIAVLRRWLPPGEAEETIGKLECGEMTDDGARQLIELYRSQQQDDRAKKVRQAP